MPTAFREYENGACPLARKRSLQRMSAMPASNPRAILPVGPIHPLSKAYLMKYETPIRMAKIPMRLSQSWPILPSSSSGVRFRSTAAETCWAPDNAEDIGGVACGAVSIEPDGGTM